MPDSLTISRGEPPAGWVLLDRRVMPVLPPFRLDLTVAVLRRTPGNLVDVWTPDRTYLRVHGEGDGALVHAVWQEPGTGQVAACLYGPSGGEIGEPPGAEFDVASILGTGVDLGGFEAAARGIPALWETVERARGVKPPCYPTLWEAVCNAVIFQQISLEAAMSVMGRFVRGLSRPVRFGDAALYPFPGPGALLKANPDALRRWGLSAAKARSLREAADAILSGRLSRSEIDALPTEQAAARLTRERGIGPWTAAVLLLRGFRRLDVFPMGDSGARRGLGDLLGREYSGEDPDAAAILEALDPWRGMLYYHLLLRRQARAGVVEL